MNETDDQKREKYISENWTKVIRGLRVKEADVPEYIKIASSNYIHMENVKRNIRRGYTNYIDPTKYVVRVLLNATRPDKILEDISIPFLKKKTSKQKRSAI